MFNVTIWFPKTETLGKAGPRSQGCFSTYHAAFAEAVRLGNDWWALFPVITICEM